jgi:hypothetical protein
MNDGRCLVVQLVHRNHTIVRDYGDILPLFEPEKFDGLASVGVRVIREKVCLLFLVINVPSTHGAIPECCSSILAGQGGETAG